jgi:hypothetical protein
MTFTFKPATAYAERHGLFIALAGGTSSGKTFSALRLARGIAGPKGKVAVVDTEAGRTLHLRDQFAFDAVMLDPPHRPDRYAEAARAAEDAGYACLVIDSFSMEWVGMGGVLDWQAEEYERMGSREQVKLASWIKPKMAHKAMVYSLLGRRIPIVFSMRADETAKKDGVKVVSEFRMIQNKAFPFEVTVSFMLAQARQGVIDLHLPHKLEGWARPIFKDGEQLGEKHGKALAAWATGKSPATDTPRAELPDKLRLAARSIVQALREARDQVSVDRILQAQSATLLAIKEASDDAYQRLMAEAAKASAETMA